MGDITVTVPITSRIAADMRPVAKTGTGSPGLQLTLTNHSPETSDISWRMSIVEEYPMKKGQIQLGSGEDPTVYFAEAASDALTLASQQTMTVTVPFAAVDPQTVYRVNAQVSDDKGRTVERNRLVSGFAAAPRARAAVDIDGHLDEDVWQAASVQRLGEKRQLYTFKDAANWTGPDDLSAKLRFAWDDAYFYIAAEVTDDVFVDGKKNGSLWQQDSLQMLVDPARTHDEKPGKYDMSVGLGAEGPQAWCHSTASQDAPAGEIKSARIAARRLNDDSGNIIYEIAFPWKRLAPFTPKKGGDLGLALILNEDDGAGRASFLGWFSGVHSKQLDMVGDVILTE